MDQILQACGRKFEECDLFLRGLAASASRPAARPCLHWKRRFSQGPETDFPDMYAIACPPPWARGDQGPFIPRDTAGTGLASSRYRSSPRLILPKAPRVGKRRLPPHNRRDTLYFAIGPIPFRSCGSSPAYAGSGDAFPDTLLYASGVSTSVVQAGEASQTSINLSTWRTVISRQPSPGGSPRISGR